MIRKTRMRKKTASSALPGTGRIAPVTGVWPSPRYDGGCSGGVSDMLLLSGCESRDVEDLQLDSVGVVEEHPVIPRHVAVLLRLPLDPAAPRAPPLLAL